MRLRVVLAAMILVALPVNAHRGHDALSVVTIGTNGDVTVSHRFEAHDIEPALAEIAPNAQASLDDPEAVAALLAYAGQRFALATDRGPIVLTAGKPEIGASEVRLLFTGKAPARLRKLTVQSSLLTDVYRGQVNQVNIKTTGGVRTLTFRGAGSQTMTIAP